MSDTHNHILCARDAIEALKNEEICSLIEKYPLEFMLGSQGGDFYAYFDPTSLKGGWSGELADLMHRDINGIMLLFAEYIFALKDQAQREKLSVYVFGFITHHALDNLTHPFIEGRRGEASHKRYEVKLDVAYALQKKLLLKDIFVSPPTREDCIPIGEMYNSVFLAKARQTLPTDFYYQCVMKYIDAMKLTDKSFYRNLAKILGAVDKRAACLNDAFYILDAGDDVSKLLNLKCESWSMPGNSNNICNLTYPQLFGYAVKDSAKRIERFYEALKRKPSMAAMERIFCGLDF